MIYQMNGKLQSLLTQIQVFVKKNLPKGYLFEDQVDSYEKLKSFYYKAKKLLFQTYLFYKDIIKAYNRPDLLLL